jgi:hypothetical protein
MKILGSIFWAVFGGFAGLGVAAFLLMLLHVVG